MGGLPLLSETERVAALVQYRILDTPAEGEFDDYARMVAQLCGTEIGAMTLLDRDRQWAKAVHGPLAREIPRDHAFCPHTMLQTDVLEVPDTLLDSRFAKSALVVAAPFVRFYAGAPLINRSGVALGTLCVLDPRPMQLSHSQRRLMVIAASHITAQLELRRAMLQLLEEKRLAAECREAVSESNRSQQQLTAMLVHDFKSPLTSVGLNAAWLADDASLSPAQQRVAREIVGASDQLAEMVNDLLDVSRAEDGQLMVQRVAEVDLSAVVRTAVERTRSVAAARGQRVDVSSPASLSCVDGDPKILARVVGNLLDNAQKYAPPDSTIGLELSSDEAWVVLRVIDQGAGIPLAQREAVFAKYFQIEEGTQARPSHGLGLAFCRLAVQAHGGTIEVEDQPGCVFRVRLPSNGKR